MKHFSLASSGLRRPRKNWLCWWWSNLQVSCASANRLRQLRDWPARQRPWWPGTWKSRMLRVRVSTSTPAAASSRSWRDQPARRLRRTLVQRRQKPDPSSLVGQGKLDEIVGVVASSNASLVLFNHDLTPSQLRNIETRLTCHVIDRSQLILDIFARHARTSEGQLQVELAQLEYQLPRLAGRGRAMSQLGRRHWDPRPW